MPAPVSIHSPTVLGVTCVLVNFFERGFVAKRASMLKQSAFGVSNVPYTADVQRHNNASA
jgi:hypothetical protein